MSLEYSPPHLVIASSCRRKARKALTATIFARPRPLAVVASPRTTRRPYIAVIATSPLRNAWQAHKALRSMPVLRG